MILKLKAIKQIIKEELEKVVNEDLYADEEEYEEAIKDFMELHKVSREEAKKAIDAAGDEMDHDHPEFKTSIENENENIKAFETLMTLARKGKNLHGKHAYLEMQELRDLSMDFKNNLQNYFKKNEYYKIVYKGYEFCKTYMFDKHGFWDKAADAYGKLNKPLLQRDIGAAITMAKLEPQLQADIEERTERCEETLAFALSYVEEQIIKDRKEAEYQARRKKEKEDREKAKNELIKKGIPEEYVSAAIKAGIVLQDALKWDMNEWEEWMEKYRQKQIEKEYRQSIRNRAWYDYLDTGKVNDPDYFTESKFRLTQNEIKQIIKEEIQNVLEQEAEQSDGGTTITAQELEKIPAAIDFKGALEQVKKQYIDTVNKNKDKLEKLSQQNADKALNEGLGMFYLALQVPALAISLAQLAAKGAAYVAKKMGRPPTDPSSEYYNDFHKTFDTYADFIKRQFQSVGLHATVLGVAKFIYRNDQAKYEKIKEDINLVMDALMVIMGIVIAYGGIDAIAKAGAGAEKMLNITGNNKIAADILGKIDEFAGYKDLFKAVLEKITV